MKKNIAAYAALALGAVEVVLVPASWVLSVLLPDSGIRSMLGGEGVRWFFGSFSGMLARPLLVWILLSAMAAGCLRRSGLWGVWRSVLPSALTGASCRQLQYRERIALLLVAAMAFLIVLGYGLLAFIPHAVLRSATGRLLPSPFSSSVVPAVSLSVIFLSVIYGIVSARFRCSADIYKSLFDGISTAAPLFLFYILLIQLYYTVVFVFG